MLSEILSQEQCATCRFCCSFVKTSTWEAPLFSDAQIQSIAKTFPDFHPLQVGDAYTIDFRNAYRTDSAAEEASCPFLHPQKGCMLSAEEKPFDCRIWPLRIMKRRDTLVIALTPTCQSINRISIDKLISLVTKGGIGEAIYRYADHMPAIVKPYRKDFPILMTREIKQNTKS